MGNSIGAARDDNYIARGVNSKSYPLSHSVTYAAVCNGSRFPPSKRAEKLLEMQLSLGKDPEESHWLGVSLRSVLDGVIDKLCDRRPLNLAVVVDVSGSMMNGLKQPTTEQEILNMVSKFESTKTFLLNVYDALSPDDMFSVCWFAEEASGTAVQPMNVTEDENSRIQIQKAIDKISVGGGTKLVLGMEQGTYTAKEMKEKNPGAETRIVFITDMCDSSEDEGGPKKLLDMTMELSEQDIHVSYIGVGVDFDHDLTNSISCVPGCNYFCILDEADFNQRICSSLNSAFVPICSHIELNVHTRVCDIKRVVGMDHGVLEKDVSWTPQTHKYYPKKIRELAVTMKMVFQRMQWHIPNDILGKIIGFIHPSERFSTKEFSIFPSLRVDDGGWVMFEIGLKDLDEEEDHYISVDLRYTEPNSQKVCVIKEEMIIPRALPVGFPDMGLLQAYDLVKFVDILKSIFPDKVGDGFKRNLTVEELKYFENEAEDLPDLEKQVEILKKIKAGGQDCVIL